MIAFLEAYRAGAMARSTWLPNLVSGLIVGIVALPLAMAFAIASGAQPAQGLYTAIVAGILVSLFGGSRIQIAGPTGAFIVILSGITAKYGIEGLQIATMMAGVLLLLMGIARLGVVLKFIPQPVILGFTAGIAVIIWIGQWKDFFGLPAITGEHFHEKFWHILQVFPQLNLTTTALSLFALCLILFTPKIIILKRVPGPLVALIMITLLQTIFQFEGVTTIGSAFGGIPQGLPVFHLPDITTDKVFTLMWPAFAIAMLGAIESLLSAVVADGMAGTKHNSNQELIGQGIANLATPLFGGFAATGAIARTATNVRNGGSNPLAGIVHGITLIVILLFLAPLAVNIPLSVLAAILFVVSWNMSEVPHIIAMLKRAPKADICILLVTFALTVFVDLVVAVNIGVMIAAFHFLKRMAASVEVEPLTHDNLQQELAFLGLTTIPDTVMIYSIEGPFFFGAAEKFERVLCSAHMAPEILIIRLGWVPFMDITGLQMLEEVIIQLHKRNIRVMLAGANSRVTFKLKRAGIINLVGVDNMFTQFFEALLVATRTKKTAQGS